MNYDAWKTYADDCYDCSNHECDECETNEILLDRVRKDLGRALSILYGHSVGTTQELESHLEEISMDLGCEFEFSSDDIIRLPKS